MPEIILPEVPLPEFLHGDFGEIVKGAVEALQGEVFIDPMSGNVRKRLPKGITYQQMLLWAVRLIGVVEGQNNASIRDLFERWKAQTKYAHGHPDTAKAPNRFGYLLVMQVMGHGVGLQDDGDVEIELPHREGPSYECPYLQF